jgi:GTP diphosphokinase / guanosine-3',5'-bis(diphosphate) 3'-diphosphatase
MSQLHYTWAEKTLSEIITLAESYLEDESVGEILTKTYIFARDAHGDQKRKSGEPYITHPLEATKLLLELKPDIISLQACILHDVIEDTDRTYEEILDYFWEEVAHICEWLSKLSSIKYRWEERTIESLRKMLVAMVDDLRVIVVKLADRLHNMQTLQFHTDPKKQERIALETLNIYAPIADRLGIFNFKEKLETECFRILHPADFLFIQTELEKMHAEQEFFISKAQDIIRKVIDPSTPILDISYRIKSPYSIFKKLKRKEYSYANARDLYDLFAIRIITDNVPHCYEILWVLHNVFVPMPKRFKDYIALPKENGYQSLHTTVVWLFPEVRSQPTEIQIRTRSMHIQAEIWVAAHFEYSEAGTSKKSQDSYWVKTIKTIIESSNESWNFMSEMKVNVFADQIFVFTPKGDIITLPKWSTPVDFAYTIHSNLWNQLTIAKVNGQVVPLDYALHNGESVQIVTDIHKKPKPIWLSFVKTSKAKEHIRQFINREERSFFIEKGRDMLSGYLKRHYDHELDRDLSILKNIDGHNLDMRQREDILVQLWNLSRKPWSILKALHDETIRAQLWTKIASEKNIQKWEKTKKKPPIDHEEITVIIGKERDIPYRFAKCCKPTPMDKKIVGAIWQGSVTIHRFDCKNVEKIELERRMPVRWSTEEENLSIQFEIECIFRDKRGLLMELTEIFYNTGLNIKSVIAEDLWNGTVKDIFILETSDEDYYIYERLESRLKFEIPELIESRLISLS